MVMDEVAHTDGEERALLELSVPGEAIGLPVGTVMIGRGASCFVRVADPMVSRQHAELRVGARVVIADLNSHNGTYVNGERVCAPRALSSGDRIQLGSRTFTLRIVSSSGFDVDAVTPTDAMHRTLRGVAVIQPTCSVCGWLLPANARQCPQCAERLRSSASRGPTETQPSVLDGAASLRRHPRYPITLSVRYTSPSYTLDAVALDLSLGGVFIATDRPDELGTSCSVLVSSSLEDAPTTAALRTGRAMAFRGFVRNVVHRGRAGMGIEFESVDERQRAWIEQRAEEGGRELDLD